MEKKMYAVTNTFYRRNSVVKPKVVIINGNTPVKEPEKTKIIPEGYRISEIANISKEDPRKFDVVKEVTEFWYKQGFTEIDGDKIPDLIPAQDGEDGAVHVVYPFTRYEAAIFVVVFGNRNGAAREIYNANAICRSNLGSSDVPYIRAIGAPIEKTLTDPRLREKITDDRGALLPFFKSKFGRKKQSRKGSVVKSKIGKLVGAVVQKANAQDTIQNINAVESPAEQQLSPINNKTSSSNN